MDKKSKTLVLILALLTCLISNVIVKFIIFGILIAFAVFKTRDENFTKKLMQPALLEIFYQLFVAIFTFFMAPIIANNLDASIASANYILTIGIIGLVAKIIFIIIGIIAFIKDKDIPFFGYISNMFYTAFENKPITNIKAESKIRKPDNIEK